MPRIDECCVLIPASTLEDFPANLSDYDARSLLAAWTVLWHPRLLADSEQTPTWYRADSPPDPAGNRIYAVPTPSQEMLPDRFEARCQKTDACQWITGGSRAEMVEALKLKDLPDLTVGPRTIGVEDFYAAGFVSLQIQVMTRRLRYTSNLDEINLQNQIVNAAQAFIDGRAAEAIESLHNVFDCLSEERDHYFSSDPHLVDLTLVTASTLGKLLESNTLRDDRNHETANATVLPTPRNVLFDAECARAIINLDQERRQVIRDAIGNKSVGWAGGGPDGQTNLDALSLADAEAAIVDAYTLTCDAIGTPPAVYARYSGPTPTDMTPALVQLGYKGLVPIDFAGGSGFGDEAKVVQESGGVSVDALTAKPIDASSDASFLDIGARLGESIDSGEIATGLFVHWPGNVCDSFVDVRRAASWGLALGRFWKLEDYFVDGEQPYHHGNTSAASSAAANYLDDLVDHAQVDPISNAASTFRAAIAREQHQRVNAMAALASGKVVGPTADDSAGRSEPRSETAAANDKESINKEAIAASLGAKASAAGKSLLVVNPESSAARVSVAIDRMPDTSLDHIFAASDESGTAQVSVDVPACGFAVVNPASKPSKKGFSLGGMLGLGGPRPIVQDGHMLQNEFMEAAIGEQTGTLQGVYSGSVRGNRLSVKLVAEGVVTGEAGGDTEGDRGGDRGGESKDNDCAQAKMQCDSIRTVSSTLSSGTIETTGALVMPSGKKLAKFRFRYTLQRGSRFISIEGDIEPLVSLSDRPWQSYFALRTAVASEASLVRILLRDKIHRAASRRIVAPLGLLVDEAERQTLISSAGRSYHRRVGDRFVDTLLVVKGETSKSASICYGIDVPSPVSAAKQLLAPAITIPVDTPEGLPDRGWIVHPGSKDIHMPSMKVARRADGKLAALVRVIQTRSQSAKATLAFCRDIDSAVPLFDRQTDPLNMTIPEDNNAGSLKVAQDRVTIAMTGHQVLDLLVVFKDS